jgi:hypothetical protein
MYSTVEYLDGFVADQWPDLETAALLVVLDPVTAREVTAAVLAAFARRWGDALEEGHPVERSRRELVRRLARLPQPARSEEELEAILVSHPADGVGSATVTDRLLRALAGQPATSRICLACDVCWGLGPAETASLTGAGVARVESDLTSIRAALLEAREDAGTEAGPEPLEGLREDLDRLLTALTTGTPPEDPVRLVSALANRARRRSVVVAGLSAAAVGALGWVVIREASPPRTAAPPATTSPAPDDGVWATTELWPARGALGADPDLASLAARFGMRLLWADDVEGLRVAIGGRVDPIARIGTTISAWVGGSGAPASSLRPLEFWSDSGSPRQLFSLAQGPREVVTLVLPGGSGSVLVVLSRPTTPRAQLSRTVTPTTAGEVVREWESVPLVGGVGVVAESTPLGPATRVRVGLFDGEPLRGDVPTEPDVPGDDLVAALGRQVRTLVAAATGTQPGRIRSEVFVDGSLRDDPAADGRPLRVVVLLSRLPNGAVVRSVRVNDGDGSSPRSARYAEVASVVPARRAHEPVIGEMWNQGPSDPGPRFLVVAPGASRARLAPPGHGPGGRASPVTVLHGGLGLAVARRRFPGGGLRLDLWDARGRRTYSAVPPEGRFLLDLG